MNEGLFDIPRYRIAGDRGLLVEFGDRIHLGINRKVLALAVLLAQLPPQGVIEVIPAYRSLLIIYDPAKTSPETLRDELEMLEDRLADIETPPSKVVEIPVCYGGEFGPDIGFVAASHGLTENAVIDIHSATEYPVCMIGFTPGFPYLYGLSEKLYTPRLESPRVHVPAGSVGIANNQTGIYSVDSPGGWQLIGRTPLMLFDPMRENSFLYDTGDRLRFVPISVEVYHKLADEESC